MKIRKDERHNGKRVRDKTKRKQEVNKKQVRNAIDNEYNKDTIQRYDVALIR